MESKDTKIQKPVILTGLRANNDLHIGHVFGALEPTISMAKKHSGDYQINLFVPDLHSFTTPIDHGKLQEGIMNNLRIFAAAGLPLDDPNIHIYRQSYIPAHSELTVILNNFTGVGELERMTQFKDKSSKLGNDRVTAGLLDYPVLMVCDILLYGAKYIPVGDDQSQHIELTRDVAQRMNNKFGDLFTVPEEVKRQHEFFGKDQGLRIKDLADPSKKMSKSDETGKGVLFLGEDPKVAAKKIISATTDNVGRINYDPAKQPGISNLLQLLSLLQGDSLQKVIDKYQGQSSYGDLKKDVAQAVEAFLSDFQSRLAQVDDEKLNAKLVASEAAMNQIANKTLLKVQKAVGLR
jgi:tryptophanyl-tRNA synthetase